MHNTIAINASAWQMEKDSGTLRIMTWNVSSFLDLHELSRPEATPRRDMYALIREYRPDVLCFQECKYIDGPILPSTKEELAEIGYRYMYISEDAVTFFGKRHICHTGSAIFLRKAAVDSGKVNIRKAEKNENIVYNDIIFDNRRLRIFTGHLASLKLYTDTINKTPDGNIYMTTVKGTGKIEHRYKEGELIHEKEAKIIKKALDLSPYPVVYCGDNNTPPTSYTYVYLKGDLRDAFIEKGFGLGGTFYKLPPTLRIDVCFVSDQCYIKQCTVPHAQLSDHYPVVTDIIWKKK